MLVESEPNDTVLEADGPVPGSGFLSTRSTSNDHDRFVLRLQPQRQVTLTLTRISGCRASTDFGLDRTDGYEEISLGNQFREVYTKSWTTPVVPVEYIGDLYGDYDSPTNQCTTSVVVSPADAVIEGPLPARAPRNAAVGPVDAVDGKDFTVTVTGNAYAGDTLYSWTSSSATTCGDIDYADVETPVPAGPYSVPVTLPGVDAGTVTVCSVLHQAASTLIPDAVGTSRVAVRAPNPMSIETRKVRLSPKGKGKLPLKCQLPSGEVCAAALTVTTTSGRAVATVSATVAAGETRRATLKVSKKVARKVAKAGVLRLTVTGTVTRPGLAVIPVRKARLLLVPPAR